MTRWRRKWRSSVRSFAVTLLVDMDSEQRGLLNAGLDAMSGDAKGG
jgi:hypothetical protein